MPQANYNTIDDRILNREQENGAARELREKRMKTKEEENEEQQGDRQPQGLRQRIMAARRALDIKQKAKEKIEEKVMAPAKQGTNWLLRWAWVTLIPSWGLTLIYINLHVFLKMVFGEKLFCKLGQEWIPKKIQAVGGEAGAMGGKAIGIVEIMGLLILDLVLFFVIIAILAILVWVADNIILKGMIWVWDLTN